MAPPGRQRRTTRAAGPCGEARIAKDAAEFNAALSGAILADGTLAASPFSAGTQSILNLRAEIRPKRALKSAPKSALAALGRNDNSNPCANPFAAARRRSRWRQRSLRPSGRIRRLRHSVDPHRPTVGARNAERCKFRRRLFDRHQQWHRRRSADLRRKRRRRAVPDPYDEHGNGVMKMRPVEGGLEMKPGETVTLKPGGDHMMSSTSSIRLKRAARSRQRCNSRRPARSRWNCRSSRSALRRPE